MKYKCRILIFLIFFAATSGLSQTLVTGHIINSKESPEDFAMVSLTNAADSTILAYGFSDNMGNFVLQCDIAASTRATVTFSKLGFKTQTKEVLITLGANIDLGTIILPAEDFLLQEVIINDKAPPVMVKNDTTVFSASHYTDGTEKKMEDLLKKIPGITVDQTGRIKYLDKNIDRVLLEGDDLLGQDYTIGTKNISSAIVGKVEVIDHYLDNPLFKEIINSDKTVINIKVKEEFKNDISGTLETGMGAGDKLKYYGNTYLIALLKKSKSLLFLNSNNIRSQDIGNANYYFENFSTAPDLSRFKTDKLEVFNRTGIQAKIDLPEQFTTTGNLSSGSINHIIRTKSGLKFTASATGLFNDKFNSVTEDNVFFNLADSLQYRDHITSHQQIIPFKARIQSEYVSLPRSFSIRTISTLLGSNEKYNYSLNRNTSSLIESYVSLKPLGLNNIFEYTKRIKKGLFQLIGDYTFMNQNENSRLSNPLYMTGILDSVHDQHVQQMIPAKVTQLGLIARFMFRKSLHTDIDIGYFNNRSSINSSLLQNNELINIYTDTISRDENIGFTQLRISKYFKRSSLAFTLYSSFHNLKTNHQDANQSFVLFAPDARYSLSFKNNWSLTLSTSIKQSLSEINQMLTGPVFVDFQTVYTGYPDVIKITNYYSSVILNKKNKENKYFFNSSLNYNSTENGLGFGTDFSQIIFKEYLFYPARKNIASFSLNGMYLIENLKSRIEGTLEASRINSINQINTFKRDIRSDQIAIQIKYGSAFRIFNINCIYDHVINYINSSLSNIPVKYTQRKVDLKLTYKPSKSFYCDLKSVILNSVSVTSHMFQGISMKLHYEPIKKLKGHNFECTISNPFNNKSYSTNFANDYYYYSQNIIAVRRFVILTWAMGF